MNHLHRELAPISDTGWQAIEDEVSSKIRTYLAARKLVDFRGPHGWSHASVNLGRVDQIDGPSLGVVGGVRRALPLVELRHDFTVPHRTLDDIDRGAQDPDLADLGRATRQLSLAENVVVFHGYEAAHIRGIMQSSTHDPLTLSTEAERYPNTVARAVDVLRQSGIQGPYGLAIGPETYTSIVETTEHGGYLLLDHLHQILEGPVVWSPGVRGGTVVSLRGGDFVLDCGQDISIGYARDDEDGVTLYLEETLTFQVLEEEASVTIELP